MTIFSIRKPTDSEFFQANRLLDSDLKLSGLEKVACNRVCDLRSYPHNKFGVTAEQWVTFDSLVAANPNIAGD